MTQQCQGSTDLQAATDEYIEQNDDRFGELAALLLQGRADLAAERIDSPAALSLGEQGRHCIMTWHALELADLSPYRSCDLCCYGHVLTLCYPGVAILRSGWLSSSIAALSCAGAQRQVLVLEAAHSTDEAAAGMCLVDEVTSVLSALPFAERCGMDGLISADASASQPSINLAKVCIPSLQCRLCT